MVPTSGGNGKWRPLSFAWEGEEIDDSSKLGFFLSPPFDGKICRKVFVYEKRKESSSPVNMDLCCFYHHQQQCDIAMAAKLIRMKQ